MIKGFSLILIIGLFSCGTGKQIGEKKKTIEIKANLEGKKLISDSFEINSVEIVGNRMNLNVSYSGGCVIRTFQMIGSTSISKSFPPKRSVQIVLSHVEDECNKMIQQKIVVDISELAQRKETGSEIILNLSGWEKEIKYVYE
jgi:hypothetical protein